MSVVVPPKAAAIVPVWKSSALVVPPKGMSRWVWTSMPPGRRRRLVASMVAVAFSGWRLAAMAEILPSEMPTSAFVVSVAVMMVPFLMMVSNRIFASGSDSML